MAQRALDHKKRTLAHLGHQHRERLAGEEDPRRIGPGFCKQRCLVGVPGVLLEAHGLQRRAGAVAALRPGAGPRAQRTDYLGFVDQLTGQRLSY
ncbi:hypothetical protein D3C71_1032370 [compost metagenome]